MNRVTNLLVLLLTFPIMAYTILVGFDLPIEVIKVSGANMPYKEVTIWILASFVFLILMRRSVRRWFGMQLMSQKSKFIWLEEISQKRKNRAVIYNSLEGAILIFLSLGIFNICPEAWGISLAYGIGFVDSLVFTLVGYFGRKWQLGITKKAVVLSDREVTAMYFFGLRKVMLSQETLYFDYIKNLHLHMPIVAARDEKSFLTTLLGQMDHDKVFVDESIKKIIN